MDIAVTIVCKGTKTVRVSVDFTFVHVEITS